MLTQETILNKDVQILELWGSAEHLSFDYLDDPIYVSKNANICRYT